MWYEYDIPIYRKLIIKIIGEYKFHCTEIYSSADGINIYTIEEKNNREIEMKTQKY